jgi:integral membrane protein
MKTALSWLRIIGIAEGISYLILLGIAMPLRTYAGMPLAVKYTGWAHGLLFILFIIALAWVSISRKWSLLKIAAAFIASLIPFGTIVMDSRWKKEELGLIGAGEL